VITYIKSVAPVVALAVISWMSSLLVREAYADPTWQYLASLAVVNFMFMVMFAYSKINDQKARWICSMLAIAIALTVISTFSYFFYQHGAIEADNPFIRFVLHIYPPMCLSLSILIIAVSLFSDRLMGRFDDVCWPGFASNFRRSFDVWRVQSAKKGAF
jgi:hypothetical protein